MAITPTRLSKVLNNARRVLPTAVCTMRWFADGDHEVSCFQADGTDNASENDMDGIVSNIRGTKFIFLADCSPWEPPKDGDEIVFIENGLESDRFVVLSHRDDPTETVRRRLIMS